MYAPRTEPAKSIYEAFQEEAKHREGRHYTEWEDAERIAVWNAARAYSKANGFPVLTLAQIQRAENSACGHVDYATKWAYRIVEMLNDVKAGRTSN